jgi:hypothetical protein
MNSNERAKRAKRKMAWWDKVPFWAILAAFVLLMLVATAIVAHGKAPPPGDPQEGESWESNFHLRPQS